MCLNGVLQTKYVQILLVCSLDVCVVCTIAYLEHAEKFKAVTIILTEIVCW